MYCKACSFKASAEVVIRFIRSSNLRPRAHHPGPLEPSLNQRDVERVIQEVVRPEAKNLVKAYRGGSKALGRRVIAWISRLCYAKLQPQGQQVAILPEKSACLDAAQAKSVAAIAFFCIGRNLSLQALVFPGIQHASSSANQESSVQKLGMMNLCWEDKKLACAARLQAVPSPQANQKKCRPRSSDSAAPKLQGAETWAVWRALPILDPQAAEHSKGNCCSFCFSSLLGVSSRHLSVVCFFTVAPRHTHAVLHGRRSCMAG